jgi:SAM-dependent methyltransferase
MSSPSWKAKVEHAGRVLGPALGQLFPDRERERRIRRYERGGRVPWTAGYAEYRARYVETALADGALLDRFGRQQALPSGYGIGLDERCVEYPWIISRIPAGPGVYLDAGSAFNHAHIVKHSALATKKLYIVTLAPEPSCFWARGISYIYDDLCALPLRDNLFDGVMSVSTLEHVGFDNALFGAPSFSGSNRSTAFLAAVRELWRVLKPGGQLLLTVPFGRYQNFGTFQQFDSALLKELEAGVGAAAAERGFYCYAPGGWQVSSERDCRDAEFAPWGMRPRAQRKERVAAEPDGAAAARAVVCIRWVKPGGVGGRVPDEPRAAHDARLTAADGRADLPASTLHPTAERT